MIDYRELLKRYMEHVFKEEGVSFVSLCPFTHIRPKFSAEEIAELQKIEREIEGNK